MRRGSLRRLFLLPLHVFSPYQHLSNLTNARTSRSVPFCWSIQNRRARVPFTAYVQATHLIKLDGDNPRVDSDRSFGYRTGILGLTRLSAAPQHRIPSMFPPWSIRVVGPRGDTAWGTPIPSLMLSTNPVGSEEALGRLLSFYGDTVFPQIPSAT